LIKTNGVFTRRNSDYYMLNGAVMADGVMEPKSLQALVVARGSVRAKRGIDDSLVIATGDIICGNELSGSMIICDGDVHVGGRVGHSLIIARGQITAAGLDLANTLIAGRAVIIKQAVLPPKRDLLLLNLQNSVEENNARPLGFITFFELSTVGIEAKAVGKVVQITAVADGKPFAQAGVRVDDIITEVNGKKPDSPESLRRLLRDALAIGDSTVKLQRGEKVETVKVVLPE
jgi:hypothetical protein